MVELDCGGKKIRIHTTKRHASDKAIAPVYAESVNILEGLTAEEAHIFLQENPTLVSLDEINVVKEAEPCEYSADVDATVVEVDRAREDLERVKSGNDRGTTQHIGG
jgi:hypothetical protein